MRRAWSGQAEPSPGHAHHDEAREGEGEQVHAQEVEHLAAGTPPDVHAAPCGAWPGHLPARVGALREDRICFGDRGEDVVHALSERRIETHAHRFHVVADLLGP